MAFVLDVGLLLGVRDFHGVGRRDLEALEGVFGCGRLSLVFKLHERDVVTTRNKADLGRGRRRRWGRR